MWIDNAKNAVRGTPPPVNASTSGSADGAAAFEGKKNNQISYALAMANIFLYIFLLFIIYNLLHVILICLGDLVFFNNYSHYMFHILIFNNSTHFTI